MDQDNIPADEVPTPPKVQNTPTPEPQINESEVRAEAVAGKTKSNGYFRGLPAGRLRNSLRRFTHKNGTSLHDARALIIDEVAKRANPAPVAAPRQQKWRKMKPRKKKLNGRRNCGKSYSRIYRS